MSRPPGFAAPVLPEKTLRPEAASRGKREKGNWKRDGGRRGLCSIFAFVLGPILALATCPLLGQEQKSDSHVIISSDPNAPASDNEVATVRNLAELTLRAVELGNGSLIAGYLSPDYFCIDVSGNSIDRYGRLKQLKDSGLKFTSASAEKQSIHLHEGAMLVTGVLDVKGSMSGRDLTGQYRYLDVWLKRDGKWLVAASTMTRVVPSASTADAAAPAK